MTEETDKSGPSREDAKAYWRASVRLILVLLLIWFTVSFGFGILFREFLDQFQHWRRTAGILVRPARRDLCLRGADFLLLPGDG